LGVVQVGQAHAGAGTSCGRRGILDHARHGMLANACSEGPAAMTLDLSHTLPDDTACCSHEAGAR